ncbi:MAG TPA: SulP family inorganic anion transporter [Myxococcota bacterium]|nr:SulP family inorganic anion transporter [Myxococcota bacterium]
MLGKTPAGPASWRHGYCAAWARRDAVAALTVALFTIPQAMAYALIAGMPPAAGIWAAVVASILGAAFGSSEFLVNGPTNAMSVLLAANAGLFAAHGDPVASIVLVTAMIGLIQLGAAALRLGRFTRFVAEPVLTGFTAGAGLYIAINQLPALLGLSRANMTTTIAGWQPPSDVVFDMLRTMLSLSRMNPVALALGAATFFGVRAFQALERRAGRRIPAPFLAVAAATAVAWAFGLGEPEQGLRKLALVRDIEPLHRGLPSLVWPHLARGQGQALLAPAFALGLLGAVEAIAIGKVLAARAGHHFDANRQLLGEGACNIGAALIGGFASSGSFTRTVVNFEAGAVTRLSCIASGLIVLAIVLAFAPAANYVPIAALAGVLVHIGVKLVNVSRLRILFQTTIGDRATLLTTFFGVLLMEQLQYALFAGIAVSVLQALRRAEGFKITLLEIDGRGHFVETPLEDSHVAEVVALSLQGELFFAAAEELERRLRVLFGNGARFLVLRLTHAYNLDATTAQALTQVAREARARGGRLVLSGVRPGLYGTFARSGVIEELGAEAVFRHENAILASTRRAIAFAESLAAQAHPRATEQG